MQKWLKKLKTAVKEMEGKKLRLGKNMKVVKKQYE